MLGRKLQSLGYALNGVRIAWREEFNFKIHVIFAIATPLAGWYLGISQTEFLFLAVLIGLVMTAEILNTALEELCDKFQPTIDPHIAKIKDLAAAAVLVSSAAALIVGVVIFLPYIAPFFS